MPKGRYTSIIQLRKYELDQRRSELAALLQRDQRYVKQIEAFDRQREAEIETARQNEEFSGTLSMFLDLLRTRRQRLVDERRHLDGLIHEQQKRVRDHHMEVKRAERLAELAAEREAKETDRVDRHAEDEISGIIQMGDYQLY